MQDSSVAVIAAVISAVAAVATGFISALISLALSKRARSQRIAEFRQGWIDDLRKNLSEFVGTVHRIENEAFPDGPEGERLKQIKEFNASLMRLESYLSLMLNHEEKPSERLIDLIRQTRGAAAIFSIDATSHTSNRIGDHLAEIDAVARIVLKMEWIRVKYEIRRFSFRARRRSEKKLLKRFEAIPSSIQKYVVTGANNVP